MFWLCWMLLTLVSALQVVAFTSGLRVGVLTFASTLFVFSAVLQALEFCNFRKVKVPDLHPGHYHLERLFTRHPYRRPKHLHLR